VYRRRAATPAYHRRVTVDHGITHIALPVTDLSASLAFYDRYARMQVVHHRTDPDSGTSVAWISDLTRPFVLVLIEAPAHGGKPEERLGGAYCHIGLGVASREEVDILCGRARAEQRTVLGPIDSGPPVGYWAYIVDPDGHNLEISFGQEVGLTVDAAADARA
jgi:catechol 2,3-dioxygenase-like lactoylglutathione lyase family enzyme